MTLRPTRLTMLAVAATLMGGSAAAHAGSEPSDDGSAPPVSAPSESAPSESVPSDSEPVSDADLDATIVCHELATALPERFADHDDMPALEDPGFWRLQAVAALGKAAGFGDPAYITLGDAADTAMTAWSQGKLDELNGAMATMRDECADIVGDVTNEDGHDGALLEMPDYDAHATCLLVDTISDRFTILEDLPGLDEPTIWRFEGLSSLGQAAAFGDEAFAALGEAAEALRRSINFFDQDRFDEAIATLREECAP